ncbi:hypothetical protein [Flavobacterium segetis]|nr:hypothetical protein [Flavobacterium segetis]
MSYLLSVNIINRVNVLSQQHSKNGIKERTTENRQPKTDNRKRALENRQ